MATSKRLLVFVCALVFLLGIEAGGFQMVLLALAAEFGLDNASMGNLVSIQFAGMVVIPLLFSRLADRFGKKLMTGAGAGILLAGCILVVLAPRFAWLALGIFAIGAGYAICESLSMAALADAYPQRASAYLNLSQAFFSIGAIISPVLVDFLMRRFGVSWRIVFILLGVSLALLLPVLTRMPYVRPARAAADPSASRPKGRFVLRGVPPLLLVGLLGAMFIYGGLENGIGYYLNVLLESFGVGSYGAFFLSSFWFAMVVSRMIFGFAKSYPQGLVAACYVVVAAALGLMAAVGGAAVPFVCAIVLGFALGPIWPTLTAMAATHSPAHSGTFTSLLLVSAGLGSTFFTFACGRLAQAADIRLSFGVMALSALAGFVLFMMSRRATAPKPSVAVDQV